MENKPDRHERWDCLDQKWGQLLSSLGYLPLPLFNSIERTDTYLDALELDGVILTGGNHLGTAERGSIEVVGNVSDVLSGSLSGSLSGHAPERDRFEYRVIEYCLRKKISLFGFCRGLQIIAHYFGAKVVPIADHVRKNHVVNVVEGSPMPLPPSLEVNSFHSFAVFSDSMPDVLQPVAFAEDGSVEALVHREHRVWAAMWHPERPPMQTSNLECIRKLFGNP